MKRRTRLIAVPWIAIAAVALVLLAAGCGSDDGGAPATLEGTSWILEPGPPPLDELGDTPPTASFADVSVSGFGGCNSFGGDYEVDGDQITFGQLASTLMACPEPQMSIETEYLAALQSATTWSIDGSKLSLGNADGEEVLLYSATQ